MKRFDVSLVFLALYIHTSILCAEAMLGGSRLVTEEGDILLSWRRILLWFLFVRAILNGDRLQTTTKQDEESGAARATRRCLLADCGGVLSTPDWIGRCCQIRGESLQQYHDVPIWRIPTYITSRFSIEMERMLKPI